MESHQPDPRTDDRWVGSIVVTSSEWHGPDTHVIRLGLRTPRSEYFQLEFTGVEMRVLENVGGTVITAFQEVPAPAPYRQFVVHGASDRFRREISIVARDLAITPLDESMRPAG